MSAAMSMSAVGANSSDAMITRRRACRRKKSHSFFASIYQKIDAKPDLEPSDKEDLKADVQDVQAEVAKGEEADESFLERRLRSIKRMAPDILETIATTLADPKAGLALVIRKVMQKAQV